MPPLPPHRSRFARLALPAALLLLLAGALAQILFGFSHFGQAGHAWGADDAYISYRYAENLASGNGLVFNPGERVEGFSNLLYVLLLAPAFALAGRNGLYAVSAGFNLTCAVAALLLLHRFARRRLGEGRAGGVALLFALTPPLWVAVASGLETPLLLLLQIALWLAAERTLEEGVRLPPPWLLPLLGALSVLARADGFLTPLLAGGYLLLRGRRRAAGGVFGATLAAFGSLTAWRLAYYGWPLPNTVYAKVDGPLALRAEHGALQLASAALATGLLFHLAVVGIATFRALRGFGWRRLDPGRGLPFPALFAAAWLAYFVYVGGDVFYDRFLLILFPMGAYLLLGLDEVRSPGRGAALVSLLLLLQLVPLRTDPRFAYRHPKYDDWIVLGRHLGAHHPGARLAIDAAGKVPFFSGLETIDMLGLTDAHIGHGKAEERGYFRVGHAKSDLDYVLGRRPDLIALWLKDAHDLPPGPSEAPRRLEERGYRLLYLLNSGVSPKRENLLVLRGAGDREVDARFAEGYRYAVFEREP